MKAKRRAAGAHAEGKRGHNLKWLLALLFVAIFLASTVPTASAGWDYRRPITITNSGSALTDYQVLVTLNTTTMGSPYGNVNADGSDLRFTNYANSTKYNYWLETWNTAGESNIWVNVTSVPDDGSKMYLWYGNSAASSASNGTNTFELFNVSNVVALWHFDEASWSGTNGEVENETGLHNGTAVANADTTSDGKFNRAGTFDGSGDYVDVATELVSDGHTGGWTGCAWIKASEGSTRRFIYETSPNYAMSLALQTTDPLQVYVQTTGTAVNCQEGNYDDGSWHFTCGKFSGTDKKVRTYADGSAKCTSPAASTNALASTDGFHIGTYRSADDRWFNGIIDEVIVFDTSVGDSTLSKIHDNYIDKIGNYFSIRKYASSEPTTSVSATEEYVGGDGVDPVPELPTIILFAVGLLVLAGYVCVGRRRRREQPIGNEECSIPVLHGLFDLL